MTEPRPIRQLSRPKKLAFGLFTAAVPFVVIEILVRLYLAIQVGPSALWYGTRHSRRVITPSWDHQDSTAIPPEKRERDRQTLAGYEKYSPHQGRYTEDANTGKRITVGINEQGFRGKDFTPKPPGTIRVTALGASSTFGFYDGDDETYPAYLESILNARCKGSPRFEVLNLGIPHQESKHISNLFLAEALPLQPDIVTFYEGNNDAILVGDKFAQRSKFRHVFGLAGGVILTFRMIESALGDPFNRRVEPEVFQQAAAAQSQEFIGNLERIRAKTDSLGIRFVVMSQQRQSMIRKREDLHGFTYAQEVRMAQEKLGTEPMTSQEMSMLAHSFLMTDLKEWATKNGVGFVDGIAALDHDRDVLATWVHLDPRGNRLLAEALADEILRDPGAANGSGRQPSGAGKQASVRISSGCLVR